MKVPRLQPSVALAAWAGDEYGGYGRRLTRQRGPATRSTGAEIRRGLDRANQIGVGNHDLYDDERDGYLGMRLVQVLSSSPSTEQRGRKELGIDSDCDVFYVQGYFAKRGLKAGG